MANGFEEEDSIFGTDEVVCISEFSLSNIFDDLMLLVCSKLKFEQWREREVLVDKDEKEDNNDKVVVEAEEGLNENLNFDDMRKNVDKEDFSTNVWL